MTSAVFVTGATGYLGRALLPRLCHAGFDVRVLVRAQSRHRLTNAGIVVGDALDACSFREHIEPDSTLVHLVGVAHPGPHKARAFIDIDLASVHAAIEAALYAQVRHLVYVSVAQPAPVMLAYQRARAMAEQYIAASGLPATILRPWYVTGPGHRWPLLLSPLYKILLNVPATRDTARRLALLNLPQMADALLWSILHPAPELTILDVEAIRLAAANMQSERKKPA